MLYIINTKSLFHRGVYLSYNSLGQNLSSVSELDCYNPRKQILEQVIGGIEGNFEITVIPNRYKEILYDFINSLDIESPNW